MKLDRLKKNVGWRMQLAPPAAHLDGYGRSLPETDEDWIVETVTDEIVQLSTASGYQLKLGTDHIYSFYTNPQKPSSDGKHGILSLHVRVFIKGNDVFVKPNARPGERVDSSPVASPLPNLQNFDPLRPLYAQTHFRDGAPTKSVGFWCGLIPVGAGVTLKAPWDHIEWFRRENAFGFKLGNDVLKFETVDSAFPTSDGDFRPMPNGARVLKYDQYRIGQTFCRDTVGVYLDEDGRIALAFRTDNLTPEPHLNVRWIMADVANSLLIMDRVRQAAGRQCFLRAPG